MKNTILSLFLLVITTTVSAQWTNTGDNTTTGKVTAEEYNFELVNYDFSKMPRTQISPMSIKLFDDYHSFRPGGTSPDNNPYGTLLSIYGRSNHWESNLYFGASTNKMYFRTSKYAAHTAENGVVGGFNDWRTLLDNKSDIKTSGLLKIEGNGDHYILNGNVGIGITSPTSKLHVAYTTSDATISKNGINVSRATRTTTNVTSYDKGFFSDIRNYSIPAGITDYGYKIGVDASSFAISEEFEGTLSRNYGIWARAGIYNASPGARVINAVGVEAQVLDNIEGTTIDNVYGVRISTGNYGKSTITNRYDLYASTASAKNYFAGNVGIGTTTPGNYKLAVAGSTGIIAEKVTVKLETQWPDYVFAKEYELPTLKEVAQQIKENGHLANIPSAKEVEENGIELGEMNKKLLEKIEELTLYTIQQEKELKELQSQKETVKNLANENKDLKARLAKIETFLKTLK